MFTGIVRAVGKVVERSPHRLVFDTSGLSLAPGASFAANGVCLTAVKTGGDRVAADLSAETLGRTTLGGLRPGDRVNLEPALRAGDELGGHILLGHVDTIGKVSLIERRGEGVLIGIAFEPRYAALLADKGSVGVDGISLTPFSVGEGTFRCAVVPYTWDHTNLSDRRTGDRVNLELDVLAKYVRTWRDR